ncbi:MAG: hypothetical protein ABIH24_09760 [Verrucomicrobiota bacterium]
MIIAEGRITSALPNRSLASPNERLLMTPRNPNMTATKKAAPAMKLTTEEM